MVRFHKVNGVQIQFTAEEEAQKDLEEQQWLEGAFDRSMENLRDKRNHLIAKTDWTANSDVTMSAEMKEYRQKLRDATEGLDTVEKVKAYEFPTEVKK